MNQEQHFIQIEINNKILSFNPGQPVSTLANPDHDSYGFPYIGALVNNLLVSLSYPLDTDAKVELLTRVHHHGQRIYRRSLSFLLGKVVKELYPKARFAVEHSLGSGYYCSFELNGDSAISEKQLTAIDLRLRELIAQDIFIERRKVSYKTAMEALEKEQQLDKYNILRYQNEPKVVTYCCDGFSDISYGPLVQRTGVLTLFKLIPYPPGFVLQFPEKNEPDRLRPFAKQPQLFQIFREHKDWGRILKVQTVGQLNEIVAAHEIDNFIQIAEGFHEKKIAQIADFITAGRRHIKWILIAGPSSSGKTTFAKRLRVQLQVNGLRPVTISTDNYFVDRDKTPRNDDGSFDFEHLEAIDLVKFNNDLKRLDAGEEVDMPTFDFEAGHQVYKGKRLRIERDQMVIIEGIHGLTPRLTEGIPLEHKYKIYVSALTQLNLDYNNRISTTDNRLIRRLVRDHQFRGNRPIDTLNMWPGVRRGEKRWIFPYQNQADVAFNSALDYELAVLKSFAEPLIQQVKPTDSVYTDARRLQHLLKGFVAIPYEKVALTSILREFIGRSSFEY